MSSGFLLINKPVGPTSFDIIRQLRRQLGIKKMGHAGTLDPLASGLLIIAVEQATKLLPLIPVNDKVYEFTIQFGEERDTGDSAGAVTATSEVVPTQNQIIALIPQFSGLITQVPPAYSAIKIKGQRAYDRIRRGEEVEMPSREVTVHSLAFVSFDAVAKQACMRVHCSSGTYVRSLARDMALAMGSVGFAARIHRTAIGQFSLEHAQEVEAVIAASNITSPEIVLSQWDQTSLTADEFKLVFHGNKVPTTLDDTQSIWVLYESKLLALGKIEKHELKVQRLFHENFL